MILVPIHQRHTDYAWADGAKDLSESCVDECTPDQLKMLIANGERQLVRMDNEGNTVGWGVFQVINYPNFRAMFVTNLVAHNAHFENFYSLLIDMAKDLGCSRIRFAAKEAQARLYRMKLKANPVYTIQEIVL